ncbi:hypothetical protein M231_02294 [Tremella mesenterica]|uniref:C2H2-type domain-containing protein n=1 Tax=Tremella mesenterica TaxID=5217 RepID=A0A4Q1BR72_TREME|nr:uncharacterized protein TREMEDRAFT_65395 [Tremella mesenterica DSM 1558]EIW66526.1 hypothetical protein TREMEDRAFT_65395 [Tremella mesenterica DSM 1558]RXK40461.1 hypothetical protein M231_02294 [Tremella mesenterica]
MSEKRDGAAPPPTRKQWDKDEWAAKAKEKDEEAIEKAKSAEAALAKGLKPKFKDKEDLPKPTKNMQQRTEDVGLNKDLNKTMLVQTTSTGKGPKGPGFYCDLCNRTLKDSLSYLDHLNGRMHLLHLGQSTKVSRSTLAQVREKIRQLREESSSRVTAKNFDFNARLEQVRNDGLEEKERRKEERKRKREEKKEEEMLSKMGVLGKKNKKDEEVEKAQKDNEDITTMMGFGGFGGVKKR